MAIISYKLIPVGGEVDKYKVTLYNGTGTTVLDSKVFVPPFPGEINDSFAGSAIIGGSTYKVGNTQYIGSITKECPLKTIVANGNVASFVVSFGYTDLDTTGAMPDLAAYTSAVQDAMNGVSGAVFNDSVPLGANVSISEFANPGDKVLFVAVPDSENNFIKWSEAGNVFQQNMDIDPSYTGSNVVFMITGISGFKVYVTRAQTDFAGAFILSR